MAIMEATELERVRKYAQAKISQFDFVNLWEQAALGVVVRWCGVMQLVLSHLDTF